MAGLDGDFEGSGGDIIALSVLSTDIQYTNFFKRLRIQILKMLSRLKPLFRIKKLLSTVTLILLLLFNSAQFALISLILASFLREFLAKVTIIIT
jgi:hypothetical protein